MKNKHPHYDLIVELISDTSKQVQMITSSDLIAPVEASNVVADKKGQYTFRLKPRKFIKGHWYPCVFKGSTTNQGHPVMYTDGKFVQWECATRSWNESSFSHIGKSLGEIKFGE